MREQNRKVSTNFEKEFRKSKNSDENYQIKLKEKNKVIEDNNHQMQEIFESIQPLLEICNSLNYEEIKTVKKCMSKKDGNKSIFEIEINKLFTTSEINKDNYYTA